MNWKIHSPLYKMYSKAGLYMRSFFVYRWMVFPFEKINKIVPPKGKIYDLGCGHGIFACFLAYSGPSRKVIGIDIDPKRISFAKKMLKYKTKNMNIDFILFDVNKFPIPDSNCFTMIDFLHHLSSVEQQKAILKRCYKLLKPGGKLIIADIDNSLRLKYWFGVFIETVVYLDMKTTYRKVEDHKKYMEELGFKVETLPIDKGYPYASYLYICTK
jgi:ubiquinone/menaquinone biosynthesis C-methylase UbiE